MSAFELSIMGAAQDLWDAQENSANWEWRVRSPSLDETYVVHDAWVDDAWDSQRRRGLQPTSRQTLVF